jgi:hypothetical protein
MYTLEEILDRFVYSGECPSWGLTGRVVDPFTLPGADEPVELGQLVRIVGRWSTAPIGPRPA